MPNTSRLTITLSGKVFDYIANQSTKEGRSMSNLISYLLERTIDSLTVTPHRQ
jgi:hypothetical protein